MPNPVILVVEDEVLLRMAALTLIEEAGFQAVGAKDAESAVAALEALPNVNVVFTDVDLGRGNDGLWLASHVKERWPSVRLIVTSGHRHVTRDQIPHGAAFFEKPYREEAVLEEVRREASATPRHER